MLSGFVNCVCVCAHGDRRAHIALINNTPLFPTLLIICQPVQVSMSQSFKKGINLLLHSRHTARHSNLLSPHRDPTLQAGLNQCFLSLFDLHPVIKCGAQKKKKKKGREWGKMAYISSSRREKRESECRTVISHHRLNHSDCSPSLPAHV